MSFFSRQIFKTSHSIKRIFQRLFQNSDNISKSDAISTGNTDTLPGHSLSTPKNITDDSYLLQAKMLNEKLHSDIQRLSPEEWSQAESAIRSYCNTRGYTTEYTQNWVNHRYRLYLSTHWLKDNFDQHASNLVTLDLGGESPMTDLLREYFPQFNWQNITSDLRYTWDKQNNSVDLLICTELLEHLSDLPEGIGDTFYKTGLRAVLQESFRVLKPGGGLFITTPNAASVIQLEAVLYGAPPWFYPLHVREYTLNELITELQEIGFLIQRWQIVHCLTIDYKKDYTKLFQILLNNNLPIDNRGDDIFIYAKKPIHSTD